MWGVKVNGKNGENKAKSCAYWPMSFSQLCFRPIWRDFGQGGGAGLRGWFGSRPAQEYVGLNMGVLNERYGCVCKVMSEVL